MNIQGTCYFPTVLQACVYYKTFSPHINKQDLQQWIQNKVDNKEIIIGQPLVKENQTLILIDNNTRYAICDID